MNNKENLRSIIKERVYHYKGLITPEKLAKEFIVQLTEVVSSSENQRIDFVKKIIDNYEIEIGSLVKSVINKLIEKGRKLSKEVLYNKLINECYQLELTEQDFYNRILKPAYKQIDWEQLEAKELKERKENLRLKDGSINMESPTEGAELFLQRLVNIFFNTGILKKDSLKEIFAKAKSLGCNEEKLATDIYNRILNENFEAIPPTSLTGGNTAALLVNNNWYGQQILAQIQGKQVYTDEADLSKFGKFRLILEPILIWLPIFVWIFYIILDMFRTNTSCQPECSEEPLSGIFNIQHLCVFILLVLILFFPHFSKRIKKPPLFLWTNYVLFGFSLIVISIIYGFQTEKLTKFDSDGFNQLSDWIDFHKWFKFPLEQIQLNSKNLKGNVITSRLDRWNESVIYKKEEMYVIVVDRTASSKSSEEFRNWAKAYKENIRDYLSSKPNINPITIRKATADSTELSDCIAAVTLNKIYDAQIENVKSGASLKGAVFIYDGIHHGIIPVNVNQGGPFWTINDEAVLETFSNKYFSTIENIPNPKKDDRQQTNFKELFDSTFETILKKINSQIVKKDSINLHLILISDFYHETTAPGGKKGKKNVEFNELEKPLNNFLNKSIWSSKQALMYKLPLASKGEKLVNDIDSLNKVIDKANKLVNKLQNDKERQSKKLLNKQRIIEKINGPESTQKLQNEIGLLKNNLQNLTNQIERTNTIIAENERAMLIITRDKTIRLQNIEESKLRYEETEKLEGIFNKAFDRNSYIYKIDIQEAVSNDYPLFYNDLYHAFEDVSANIKFCYSDQSQNLNSFANILFSCDAKTNPTDKITITLTENGLTPDVNKFDYQYYLENCSEYSRTNNKQIDPDVRDTSTLNNEDRRDGGSLLNETNKWRSGFVGQKVILDSVNPGSVLHLEFNKLHFENLSPPLFMEVYWANKGIRKRYVVEFCHTIPNMTNFVLLFFYAIGSLSFLFSVLFPLHFLYFKKRLAPGLLIRHPAQLALSIAALCISVILFSIPVFKFFEYWRIRNNEVGLNFMILVFVFITINFFITFSQYRYYFSKYLFFRHKNVFEYLSGRSGRWPFLSIRKNGVETLICPEPELTKQIDLPRSYK